MDDKVVFKDIVESTARNFHTKGDLRPLISESNVISIGNVVFRLLRLLSA